MGATVEESFRRRLEQAPSEWYHAIVRTKSDPAPLVADCARQGIRVERQFRLIPGLALVATGEVLLALAQNPLVSHIEPDREVGV